MYFLCIRLFQALIVLGKKEKMINFLSSLMFYLELKEQVTDSLRSVARAFHILLVLLKKAF